jgi:hypothetical protein
MAFLNATNYDDEERKRKLFSSTLTDDEEPLIFNIPEYLSRFIGDGDQNKVRAAFYLIMMLIIEIIIPNIKIDVMGNPVINVIIKRLLIQIMLQALPNLFMKVTTRINHEGSIFFVNSMNIPSIILDYIINIMIFRKYKKIVRCIMTMLVKPVALIIGITVNEKIVEYYTIFRDSFKGAEDAYYHFQEDGSA